MDSGPMGPRAQGPGPWAWGPGKAHGARAGLWGPGPGAAAAKNELACRALVWPYIASPLNVLLKELIDISVGAI